MRRARTHHCRRMRRSLAPSRPSVRRWPCQFWPDCTINIYGCKFATGTGGIFWIVSLHAWPALRRWLRPSPLAIIYKPAHASVRHRNMRDYHIELRNCTTDQTISDVIVTWDETPFTRFIDKTLSRDWLLSPTSIGPSSSASILLFSLKDDLRIVENKNGVLGLASTFTVRASGKGIDDLTARFRYEPDKVPKLRRLWR